MQLLKSENVVKVLDVMESSHNYYIIQEICDNDLEKYLAKTPKLHEGEAINFLKQICNGFMSLVKEGIVHRYPLPHAETSSPPTSCSAKAQSRSVTLVSPRRTSQNA